MNVVGQPKCGRRGRPVARALLAVLLVATWLVASGALEDPGSATTGPAGSHGLAAGAVPVASTSYVVRPGDTLWSVARAARPDGDLRPLVDDLARQTGGRPLRPGQRIRLP